MSSHQMRWSDLEPEPGIVDALDHAGPRPEDGNQNEKRGWSERFTNACAVTIAKELRRVKVLQNKRILPLDLKTGTEPLTPLGAGTSKRAFHLADLSGQFEPLTPLGAGTSKRIDVTVADVLLGLEIGVSLKGLNFRDVGNGNFDKNLTGRLYELGDEVRLIHEHLPHAFVAGIFFLPIEAAADKQKGRTSFAHTVVKLRERTGRLDPALAHHAPRCDIGFVALYATGDEAEGYARGAVRFLNVMERPPFRGRPVLESTQSLSDVVEEVVARATDRVHIEWADPEPDA